MKKQHRTVAFSQVHFSCGVKQINVVSAFLYLVASMVIFTLLILIYALALQTLSVQDNSHQIERQAVQNSTLHQMV